ncbi:HDOD domain-containing protein [Paraglaciecola sp.]|uniref:HDOD domain-containing protein n=1 Tax=Paraglaciecola sp. TaxID=1920173 RepID=UPI003EFA792A
MPITFTSAEKAILQDVAIPPRPQALIDISAEAKKNEPDVSVIAKIISSDISISSSVLQVVNSAAFSRGKEITSIQQAVMTLGFKRVLPLVKSVALKSSMAQNDQLDLFWQQASLVATACSKIAQALGKTKLVDHVYMLGLFHNAGIPIMLLEFPSYSELLQQAETTGWSKFTDLERDKFGASHTTISTMLGQKWTLPAVMSEVIYNQHDIEGIFESGEISATGLELLSILKIARYAVFKKTTGETENEEWQLVTESIQEFLGVEDVDLENIIDDVLEDLN